MSMTERNPQESALLQVSDELEEGIFHLNDGIGAMEIIVNNFFGDGEQEAFDRLTSIKGLEEFRNTLSALQFTLEAIRKKADSILENADLLLHTAIETARITEQMKDK